MLLRRGIQGFSTKRDISAQIPGYQHKTEYISARSGISAQNGIYQRKIRDISTKRNISAQDPGYQHKTEYISADPGYQRTIPDIGRKSEYATFPQMMLDVPLSKIDIKKYYLVQ